MKKKVLSCFLSVLLALTVFGVAGCSSSDSSDTSSELDLSDWDAVVEAARGTTVTFYGYGADETFNQYMEGTVADYMLENYDIVFEWVGMPTTDDVVTMVSDEKQAGVELGDGATDLLWLGSFQFASMKENDLLYENFLEYVPNVANYVADDCPVLTTFSGVDNDGFAVPWDPTQFVLIHDSATTSWVPSSAEEFLEWCQEYEGFITYPTIDNSYGKCFVWMLLVDYLGEDWYADLDENSTYDEVKEAMEPGLEFLRELNPYLWNEGQSYPSSPSQQLQMFANGEIGVTIDWTPYSVGAHVADGTFADTAEAFYFDSGMVESWDGLLCMPYNCSNVAGAIVVANALLTPELGYAMLAETGYPPAIDYDKLSDEEKEIADAIDVGVGSISQEEVASATKVDSFPAWMSDMLVEIWNNEVAGQYNE